MDRGMEENATIFAYLKWIAYIDQENQGKTG